MRAREAALVLAKRALEDTVVRAPHAGRVVGLAVKSGEIVAPSQSLFTLVASDEWYTTGNFPRDRAQEYQGRRLRHRYSLIDRAKPIKGRVTGISSGVPRHRCGQPAALRPLMWRNR